MEWNHTVVIYLALDCTPPQGLFDNVWNIADDAWDRIEAFTISQGGTAKEPRLEASILHVQVEIPVVDAAAAGGIFDVLNNALPNFPPVVPSNLPKFSFISQGVPDAV